MSALLTLMVSNLNAQTILYEDFNNNSSSSVLPAGWTVYGDTLTNHPSMSQYNQSWQVWYPDGTIKSGEAMTVCFTTGTYKSCSRWLITPRIALPADSVMSLLFKHRCSVCAQFSVRVSTTGTDTADFTTEIGWITAQAEKNGESISLANFAGDSIYIAFVNNERYMNGGCARFIALDDIEVTHLPENSVALADVILPEQAVVNQPFTATLKLLNTGNNFIRSITYSYSINGGEPVVGTINNISNRCWRISQFNVAITPTELGEATIEFKLMLPNGVADHDSTDNVLVRKLMVVNEPPVGISTVEQDAPVVAYPNPTHGKVAVSCLESLTSAILTDMAGRRKELRLNAVGNGSYNLDISSCPQGAYFLVLTTVTGQQHTVKLMKK